MVAVVVEVVEVVVMAVTRKFVVAGEVFGVAGMVGMAGMGRGMVGMVDSETVSATASSEDEYEYDLDGREEYESAGDDEEYLDDHRHGKGRGKDQGGDSGWDSEEDEMEIFPVFDGITPLIQQSLSFCSNMVRPTYTPSSPTYTPSSPTYTPSSAQRICWTEEWRGGGLEMEQ